MELRLKYTYSKLSPEVIHPQATQRTMGSMQIPAPAPFMLAFKMNKKTSQQHRQPSWILFRLGSLGMNKVILIRKYATAGSEKDRFILDFRPNSNVQDTFSFPWIFSAKCRLLLFRKRQASTSIILMKDYIKNM